MLLQSELQAELLGVQEAKLKPEARGRELPSDRSRGFQTFPCLDCEGIKAQGILCPGSLLAGTSLGCYLVI